MCAPAAIPLAAVALSSAGTASSFIGGSQAASSQASYQNQMYRSVVSQAKKNYFSEIAQNALRNDEAYAQASQTAIQADAAATQARSAAAASAGEAGVTGNSVSILLSDYDRIAALNRNSIATNLSWSRLQNQEELKAMRAENQSRISGATPAPVQMPSALAASLQIGSTALQGFDQFQRYTNQSWPGYIGNNRRYS